MSPAWLEGYDSPASALLMTTRSNGGPAPDQARNQTTHCKQLLEAQPKSSMARYRLGEIYFARKQYQEAANAFRGALDGDREPRWVVAWSYVSLGKIFDVTRSRDRAVHFYRFALTTKDNTRGAMDEASKYLQAPFTEN